MANQISATKGGVCEFACMDDWSLDLESDLELPDSLDSLVLPDFPLLLDELELPPLDLTLVGDSLDADLELLLNSDYVPAGFSSTEEEGDASLLPEKAGFDKGSGFHEQETQCTLPDGAETSSPSHSPHASCSLSPSSHHLPIQGSRCGEESKEEDLALSSKKRMRLLKNRESANQSRQRRKLYIRDLEVKCRLLENEVNQLRQKVSMASTENIVLSKEIARLKTMKKSNGVPEPAVLSKDSLPLEFLSRLTFLCLMVELFRVAGLYLGLFLLIAHQLPWQPNPRENSQADGAGRNSNSHIYGVFANYTTLLTRPKRCYAFWRRRWRQSRFTLQIAV